MNTTNPIETRKTKGPGKPSRPRIKTYHGDFYSMDPLDINKAAIRMLDRLLTRGASINLIWTLTGISRATIYSWLDEAKSYEQMGHRDAAWFVLVCETDPKIKMYLQRGDLPKKVTPIKGAKQ